MLWFRAPEKVYFKKGCLPVALDELKDVMGKKRAFIVTDSFLYKNGYTKPITDKLDEMGITHYYILRRCSRPDACQCAEKGAEADESFRARRDNRSSAAAPPWTPAKIMWVLYEHPEVDFMDMAMRFMDIRKTCLHLPEDGRKGVLSSLFRPPPVPASEVTPFAVITDENDRHQVSSGRLSAACPTWP